MTFHAQIVSCLIASTVIATSTHANIRDYYEEPGLNPFKETINQNFGEHIDPPMCQRSCRLNISEDNHAPLFTGT